ncbi:hypothetical protein MFLO_03435 [Listeria floridensis FSL S10-1187]|uniref:DUF4352 domain-containing protein n=1 Tax=Listeria floridensis FSL S10-1187 TaxID=1265817 RepID=A0ABN0RHD1_9LIST|nr:DUF4352 domain-containing protein [Listeria floridensis]EUJ33355.1 hypothetical protein MFLO_03435 [Listeria floridensis FSL S10-1187]
MVFIGILGIISFFAFVLLIIGIVLLFIKVKKWLAVTFVSVGGGILLISLIVFTGAFLFYVTEANNQNVQVEESSKAASDNFYDEYDDEYLELDFGKEGKNTEQVVVKVTKPTTGDLDERGIDKYYKMNVTMRNDSKETVYVSAKDFFLYNYEKDEYPEVLKKDYFHEKIDPGKTVTFSIYYQYIGKGKLEVEYDNLLWHE